MKQTMIEMNGGKKTKKSGNVICGKWQMIWYWLDGLFVQFTEFSIRKRYCCVECMCSSSLHAENIERVSPLFCEISLHWFGTITAWTETETEPERENQIKFTYQSVTSFPFCYQPIGVDSVDDIRWIWLAFFVVAIPRVRPHWTSSSSRFARPTNSIS